MAESANQSHDGDTFRMPKLSRNNQFPTKSKKSGKDGFGSKTEEHFSQSQPHTPYNQNQDYVNTQK